MRRMTPLAYLILAIATVVLGIGGSLVTGHVFQQWGAFIFEHVWWFYGGFGIVAFVFVSLSLLAFVQPAPSQAYSDRFPDEHKAATATIPKPPVPYFRPRYQLRTHFTGRAHERRTLTEWLTIGPENVLAYVAIGGMGKSALTWAWLQRDVLGHTLPNVPDDPPDVCEQCRVPEDARPVGVIWWSFYEREASFATFVDKALSYASSGDIDASAIQSTREKAEALANLLQEHRFLIVLDGFERELRAYASMNAAYQGDKSEGGDGETHRTCADPHAAWFLREIASGAMLSRALITSRLFPKELEGLAWCCDRSDLIGLKPEDAREFFNSQGIAGTLAELKRVCEPLGYHPLAMSLLAGVIRRGRTHPSRITDAERYPIGPELIGKEQHHILTVSYDEAPKHARRVLSRMAAFRGSISEDALEAIDQSRFWFIAAVRDQRRESALAELTERYLVTYDDLSSSYDMHPIVRAHAYDRLTDKEGVHSALRSYFDAIPKRERTDTVADLAPIIELYHHTVRAGQYDEACSLVRDRLESRLYFQFGRYATIVELLSALFPGSGRRPPRLERQSDQAWALQELANAYGASGQLRQAAPLFEMSNEIHERLGNYVDVAVGLYCWADDDYNLGDMVASEHRLQRSIELLSEAGDEGGEAIAHEVLGRLLSYMGQFDEAASERKKSTDYCAQADNVQGICVDEADRALSKLQMRDPRVALDAALRSRELADETAMQRHPYEHDFVRAEWLIGASLVAFAEDEADRRDKHLTEADIHLTEALARCHQTDRVDHEPDILLEWAKWHRLKGDADEARKHADEALSIADRCEYRLKQADIHAFFARLALDAGDRDTARQHAETAKERAWCDGPPHYYKPRYEEAEELLEEAGEPT